MIWELRLATLTLYCRCREKLTPLSEKSINMPIISAISKTYVNYLTQGLNEMAG